jgi:hypothetical protein
MAANEDQPSHVWTGELLIDYYYRSPRATCVNTHEPKTCSKNPARRRSSENVHTNNAGRHEMCTCGNIHQAEEPILSQPLADSQHLWYHRPQRRETNNRNAKVQGIHPSNHMKQLYDLNSQQAKASGSTRAKAGTYQTAIPPLKRYESTKWPDAPSPKLPRTPPIMGRTI